MKATSTVKGLGEIAAELQLPPAFGIFSGVLLSIPVWVGLSWLIF